MVAGCGMVQVASEVRKRRYSRRLGSARYPQIPAALPGAAGKRRQGPVSSIKRPWLFVWHKICVGTRRPRGRVSAAKPSACSTAVCGRRCADSSLRMVFTLRSSVKIRTKTHVSLRLRLAPCACAVNELRASLRGALASIPKMCAHCASVGGVFGSGMGTGSSIVFK